MNPARNAIAVLTVITVLGATAATASALPMQLKLDDPAGGSLADAPAFTGSPVEQAGANGPDCQAIKPILRSTAGYSTDGGADPPVGGAWTAFVAVEVIGNPCPLGTLFVSEQLTLPAGTTVASAPVQCRWQDKPGSQVLDVSATNRCPAPVIQAGGAVALGMRELAKGNWFRIDLPVTSSATVHGAITAAVTTDKALTPSIARPSVWVPGGTAPRPTTASAPISWLCLYGNPVTGGGC